MKLASLYQVLDGKARKALADKASVDVQYLYQMATRWRGKRPSVDVIGRLIRADSRLSAADLIAEFAEVDEKDASNAEQSTATSFP